MQAFAVLALAAVAIAAPLEARNDGGYGGGSGGSPPSWGSCPKDSQYDCTANALANILVCNSIASGNTISIPLSVARRDVELTRRWGDKPEATCCTTNALLNLITCNSILSGNSISVPISLLTGTLKE